MYVEMDCVCLYDLKPLQTIVGEEVLYCHNCGSIKIGSMPRLYPTILNKAKEDLITIRKQVHNLEEFERTG